MVKKKTKWVCPPNMHIVKRRGHKEKFDERKVYGSAYAACLSAHLTEQKAERIAEKVTTALCRWIKNKKTVTAHQVYAVLVKEIKKHDKNAAFMYETHMDVS